MTTRNFSNDTWFPVHESGMSLTRGRNGNVSALVFGVLFFRV